MKHLANLTYIVAVIALAAVMFVPNLPFEHRAVSVLTLVVAVGTLAQASHANRLATEANSLARESQQKTLRPRVSVAPRRTDDGRYITHIVLTPNGRHIISFQIDFVLANKGALAARNITPRFYYSGNVAGFSIIAACTPLHLANDPHYATMSNPSGTLKLPEGGIEYLAPGERKTTSLYFSSVETKSEADVKKIVDDFLSRSNRVKADLQLKYSSENDPPHDYKIDASYAFDCFRYEEISYCESDTDTDWKVVKPPLEDDAHQDWSASGHDVRPPVDVPTRMLNRRTSEPPKPS